jgi:hypothetical protein
MYTLPVTIGDATKELVFDSGMGEDLTLVKSFTDEIGVRGTPGRDRVGFGAPVPTDTTHLDNLKIGPLPLVPLFLKISANNPPGGNGALGAHFASTYHLILDYTQDAMYLHAPLPSGSGPVPGVAPRPDDIAIPLKRMVSERTHRVRYFVPATVNGVALLLALDTGADDYLVLDQQSLSDLQLAPTASSAVQGIGGIQKSKTGTVDSITIGALHIGSLPFTALDMSAVNHRGKEEGFPKIGGILGAAILDAHGAIVDFGQSTLYLWK